MRVPTRKTRSGPVVEPEVELEPEPESGAERRETEFPRAREERLPMVAIVGRPNVGKSTLFNRILGSRRALVHEIAGMTRDRRIERVEAAGRAFLCVDTGGFDVAVQDPLYENVVDQARLAIEEADVIIYLTAAGEDRHPAEQALTRELRRTRKPVILAVNKCDNDRLDIEAQVYHRLGFKEVHLISALHGRGVLDLLDAVAEKLRSEGIEGREAVSGGIAVAVVGRQNVGKSSLINRILGQERLIASDVPGTTRDAIDTSFTTEDGQTFTLIDTAGIRRRGKVEVGIEKIAVLSSMIAIRRADVAIIVIDSSVGLTAQDAHIASYCVDEGCACVLVMNKWDLVEKTHKSADEFTKNLEREWPFLRYAPVLYVSAKSGQRAGRILEVARTVYQKAGHRIPTARLNELLQEWIRIKPPDMRRNRQLKIKYMTQVGVHPPVFLFVANDPTLAHFSYRRYLSNRIREEYDFEGSPIRIIFKSRAAGTRETADIAD